MSRKRKNVLKNNVENADDIDSLSVILNKTWHMYWVSHIFHYPLNDPVMLKKYRKYLRESLAEQVPKENCSYNVNVKYLKKVTDEKDAEISKPLMIEVTRIQEDKHVNVYTGIMIFYKGTNIKTIVKDSLNTPMLLCHGTSETIKIVHHLLGLMFDCIVVPLPVNEDDLKWTIAIALKTLMTDFDGELKIIYKIPYHTKLDDIIITFDLSDIEGICKCIFKSQESDITSADVQQLVEFLHYQLLTAAELDLDQCIIYKIILPTLCIEDNKLKVTNMELLNTLLTYFHKECDNKFYS